MKKSNIFFITLMGLPVVVNSGYALFTGYPLGVVYKIPYSFSILDRVLLFCFLTTYFVFSIKGHHGFPFVITKTLFACMAAIFVMAPQSEAFLNLIPITVLSCLIWSVYEFRK